MCVIFLKSIKTFYIIGVKCIDNIYYGSGTYTRKAVFK